MGRYKVILATEEEHIIEDAVNIEDAEEQAFDKSQLIKENHLISSMEVIPYDIIDFDVWIEYQQSDGYQDYYYFKIPDTDFSQACRKAQLKFHNMFNTEEFVILSVKIKWQIKNNN